MDSEVLTNMQSRKLLAAVDDDLAAPSVWRRSSICFLEVKLLVSQIHYFELNLDVQGYKRSQIRWRLREVDDDI